MTARQVALAGLIVALALAACPSAGDAGARPGCDAGQLRRALLRANGVWRAERALERAPELAALGGPKVVPVDKIRTQILAGRAALWVETYGAEFNAVRLRVARGRLSMTPPVFLRPYPAGGPDQAANLVKPYAGENVRFGVSAHRGNCSAKSFVLAIENIPFGQRTLSERWLFRRVE